MTDLKKTPGGLLIPAELQDKPRQQPAIFDLSNPDQVVRLGGLLQQYVKNNGLSQNIKGKSYTLVEGWQFAANQMGLLPMVEEVINESTYREIKFTLPVFAWVGPQGNKKRQKTGEREIVTESFKYRTRVNVYRMSDNKLLSRGIVSCTNSERGKEEFEEYAIESMSQTRAIGKALRNLLSFLMKAAGFETTPAEEMDQVKVQEQRKQAEVNVEVSDVVRGMIKSQKTKEELLAYVHTQKHLHNLPEFQKLAKDKHAELEAKKPVKKKPTAKKPTATKTK